MLANFELLIYSTLLFTPPLLIAALGCNLTICAGIVNIGLDGFMTVGAFVGCVSTYIFQNALIGLIFAGAFTSFFSILFAILVLKIKINEILVGFVFNILLPAMVILVCYIIFGSSDTKPLASDLKIPILYRPTIKPNSRMINFLLNFTSSHVTTYFSFILVFVVDFILNKTKIGLYIRACNANKLATKYVGIDTEKLQYISIVISGFFYGISGAIVTMAITNQYKITSICGEGYIALAAVLFGESKPINIMVYCLIFGFFSGLKTIVPSNSAIVHLVQMIPYIATVIILLIKYFFRYKKIKKGFKQF